MLNTERIETASKIFSGAVIFLSSLGYSVPRIALAHKIKNSNTAEKKRGTLLTLWLDFTLIANAMAALAYFRFGSLVTAVFPKSAWAIPVFGALALLNMIFTIFLFRWKTWAFFAICASSGIAVLLNFIVGLGIFSILGLFGPVILYLLLRSKWSYLESEISSGATVRSDEPKKRASASKKRWILIAIAIVIAAVGVTWLQSSQPPVGVYSRPTPALTTDPASLLPVSVAGMTRINVEANEYEYYVDAVGTYQGDIQIEITRFISVEDAWGYINYLYDGLMGTGVWLEGEGVMTTGDKCWFIRTVSDQSVIVWRKDVWVFEVYAPTSTLRDDAVQGLNF